MNKIHRAILDGKIEEVRHLARVNPELLLERTDSGSSALDLARNKGVVQTVVALLRVNAPDSGSESDWPDLLIRYLKELSYFHGAAGWLGEIEYTLWHYAQTRQAASEDEDPHRLSTLSAEDYEDLMFLAERAQGWPTWSEHGLSLVPLSEWSERYQEWLKQQ